MIFKFDKDVLKRAGMLEALSYISEENRELKSERDYLINKMEQKHAVMLSAIKLKNQYHEENKKLKAELQGERMLKLRLGDRVAVYPSAGMPFRGTIFNMLHDKIFVIEDGFYSGHSDNPFLPSQCKKLRRVKKK